MRHKRTPAKSLFYHVLLLLYRSPGPRSIADGLIKTLFSWQSHLLAILWMPWAHVRILLLSKLQLLQAVLSNEFVCRAVK